MIAVCNTYADLLKMQLSFTHVLSFSLPFTLTLPLVLQVNVEERPNVDQVMEKAFFRALKQDSN